jgi:hypothetical protein
MEKTNYLLPITGFIALVLWLCVAWGLWEVLSRPLAQSAPTQTTDAVYLFTFASSTETQRKILEQLASVDVVTAARAVEQAGKDVGVAVKVGGSTVTAANPLSTKNPSVLDSAYLAIDAQGTFAQLTRLVTLLENLPNPSMLDQFQITKTGDVDTKTKSSWRLSARIRVLFTTGDTL